MAVLSLLLFALSANLDNFVIGLSYGMRGIRVRLESGILISGLILVGTTGSMVLGEELMHFLPLYVARLLGSLTMAGLGSACVWNVWKHRAEEGGEDQWPTAHPEQFDRDGSRWIDWKESLALGSALALNNIGLGLGAGAAGIKISAAGILVIFLSFGLLYSGNLIGRKHCKEENGRKMEILSGILMIFLGICTCAF